MLRYEMLIGLMMCTHSLVGRRRGGGRRLTGWWLVTSDQIRSLPGLSLSFSLTFCLYFCSKATKIFLSFFHFLGIFANPIKLPLLSLNSRPLQTPEQLCDPFKFPFEWPIELSMDRHWTAICYTKEYLTFRWRPGC